jgi:hypothetical protein
LIVIIVAITFMMFGVGSRAPAADSNAPVTVTDNGETYTLLSHRNPNKNGRRASEAHRPLEPANPFAPSIVRDQTGPITLRITLSIKLAIKFH